MKIWHTLLIVAIVYGAVIFFPALLGPGQSLKSKVGV